MATISFTFDAGRTDLKATRQRLSDDAYWNFANGRYEAYDVDDVADYGTPLAEGPAGTYTATVPDETAATATTDRLYARAGGLLAEDFDEEFPRWLDGHDNEPAPPFSSSPGYLVARYLINWGAGTDPTLGEEWPVFAGSEPPAEVDGAPTNTITTFDTTGLKQARLMRNGRTIERHGIQVRVRSDDYTTGFSRAAAVRDAFDQAVRNVIALEGGRSFRIDNLSRTTAVVFVGADPDNSALLYFTVNARATITPLED